MAEDKAQEELAALITWLGMARTSKGKKALLHKSILDHTREVVSSLKLQCSKEDFKILLFMA
jgi:hypothetical protein